jgi:hypothetical protein
VAETRRDLVQPKMSPEHVACNVVLQLHGYQEAQRARADLHRHGHDIPLMDVASALNAVLVRGWGE